MQQSVPVQRRNAPQALDVWEPECADFEPICEINLNNGGFLLFVDEGRVVAGSSIGIIEVPNAEGHRVLPAFVQAYSATPLEVYRAFMPQVAHPPRVLIEDHRRVGEVRSGVNPEPRTLTQLDTAAGPCVFLPHSTVADPAPRSGVFVKPCSEGATLKSCFRQRVDTEFGDALAYHQSGRDLRPTKRGVTGLSTRRALGVCNADLGHEGSAGFPVNLAIECEWTRDVWIRVPNVPETLSKGKSVTYVSDSWPLLLRYRVTVTQPINPLESFHLEGAW